MYRLEIDNFGEWELVEEFDDPFNAIDYGEDNFTHNTWRVIDRTRSSDDYEYYHSPFESTIQVQGQLDLDRFQRSRDFVQSRERLRRWRDQRQHRRNSTVYAHMAEQIFDRVYPRRDLVEDKVDWMKEGF